MRGTLRGSTRLFAAMLLAAAMFPAATLPASAHSREAHQAEAGEWPKLGINGAETRYSPLDKINRQNIGKLGLAWQFSDFTVRGRTHRGNQATPLMVDGTLYFSGPWTVVYALDAKTGKHLWTYDPEADGEWARRACCDVGSKGVAVADGVVYVATTDGYLDAVDAKTGKRAWRVDTLTDRSRSYIINGAPRIAGDKIIVGNSGADMGVRGYFTAYDRKTGKQLWRFFTVPAGPDPSKDEHPEVTQARETWGKDTRWDIGVGGTAYDAIAYDEALNLVYVGTSNGAPHPGWLRDPADGDNLFLSSILAVDADTGRLKWYYQTTPNDSWDFGSVQHIILADVEIAGKPRKVLMQAPKNGFFYVLDRETGELLSAEKFSTVTWAEKVDMKTGRPVVAKELLYKEEPKIIWPAVAGAHNWHPMSYSEQTGLVYIPVLEAPMKYVAMPAGPYRPGSMNEAKGPPLMPPFNAPGDDRLMKGQPKPTIQSVLRAWDPRTGKAAWSSEPTGWWSGGTLATAGGLVFQGGADGSFRAYDAANGKVLKKLDTGIAIMAGPMSYAIDGEQYVAVLGGFGGAMNGFYPPGSAPRTYENQETLFVFKVGGGAVPLPPKREPAAPEPLPPLKVTDTAVLAKGQELFFENCARCHAPRGTPNGYPDLWNLPEASHEAFQAIVHDGAFGYAGMAAFKDILSPADIDAIHAFIISDQHIVRKSGDKGEVSRFGH